MADNKKITNDEYIKKTATFPRNHSALVEKQKMSITGMILLVVIVFSFLFAPLFSFIFSGGINQLKFGSYASRPVEYTADSYFAQLVEMQRRQFNSLLNGSYAYTMMRYIMQDSFHQAMMREAWVYEAQRAGVHVSGDSVVNTLHEIGYTGSILSEMSVVDRSEIFKRQQQESVVSRFQKGALDGVFRSEEFVDLLLNPGKIERRANVMFFPFEDVANDFLDSYVQDNMIPLQKWQMRRYVHVGDSDSAKEIAEQLDLGETTIAELAFMQSQSLDLSYRDAYAESSGVMPGRLLYQIQQEVDIPLDGLHVLFSGLPLGAISYPVGFTSVPGEEEAYVFYQLEANPIPADMMIASDKDAVLTYLLNYDRLVLSDYYDAFITNIDFQNTDILLERVEALGGKVVESDYFSIVYEANTDGKGYSPYQALITQFEKSLGSFDVSIVQGLLNSRDFFSKAFSTPIGELSDSVFLQEGVVWVIPFIEGAYSSSNRESDSLYINQFLRSQAQLSMENYFKNSRYYRDDKFDKAFTQFTKRIGLSPEMNIDSLG